MGSIIKEDRGMKITNRAMRCFTGIIFFFIAVASCAGVPELKVNYRLPPKSNELKGKKVFLSFEDSRTAKDILGKGAQKEFKGFAGNVTFSVARGKEKGFKMGVYEIPSLFMDVFKRRLEYLGVEVVSERKKGQIEVVIVLKEFLLDLIGRKWVVTMGYEARLLKDQKFLAKQMISGQGERHKVVGRGQAEIVMGDIFTDLVNKLDVKRLFQQGSL